MAGEFEPFAVKMRADGQSGAAIAAFESNYRQLCAEHSGMIAESDIRPVGDLPRYDSLPDAGDGTKLMAHTVVIKLNGGLGTSMGLDRAKSLIAVKDGRNFLDLFLGQVDLLEKAEGVRPAVVLMNSFSTDADTRAHLARTGYGAGPRAPRHMVQSRVPKVDVATRAPALWPADPELEWCPAGHGDIYPTMLGSGVLEELLAAGVRYAFVSNSDNLGASLDTGILGWFDSSGAPFLMEVAERTAADRKGGHLARQASDGRLVLRESAQCPEEDVEAFQDTGRHRYFNTNNLWLRLEAVRDALRYNNGALPLPMIRNSKTVDPRDPSSPAVYQLESAMGAAIGMLEDARALVVPRSRFAPVKTTADLLALRSDAYVVEGDGVVRLASERQGRPVVVKLADRYFKKLADYERRIPPGAEPSLLACDELEIQGDGAPEPGARLEGRVVIRGIISMG